MGQLTSECENAAAGGTGVTGTGARAESADEVLNSGSYGAELAGASPSFSSFKFLPHELFIFYFLFFINSSFNFGKKGSTKSYPI